MNYDTFKYVAYKFGEAILLDVQEL